MKCKYHCCSNEVVNTTKHEKEFCSGRCKNCHFVDKRRKKLKLMSVEYKGSQCSLCGYSKCIAALQFHHRDPATKLFNISHCHTRSWESIKAELDKCDILCANCHAEKEYSETHDIKYKLMGL